MKIYVLGDSFTDNLYKREMIGFKNNEGRGNEIAKYINLIRNQNNFRIFSLVNMDSITLFSSNHWKWIH